MNEYKSIPRNTGDMYSSKETGLLVNEQLNLQFTSSILLGSDENESDHTAMQIQGQMDKEVLPEGTPVSQILNSL